MPDDFDVPDGWDLSDEVRAYLDTIEPKQQPTFHRIMRLVFEVRPDASAVISYQMPTFVSGQQRLYVGAWKNWVSLYGWSEGQDGGFLLRHPELSNGKGTLQLKPAVAEKISDEELRSLVEAALTPQD